ncbi:DNA recombination protein RmuC [Desulfosarcina alkanivorans]|uniref:DNA recombination protein RmuC n=1 Tax=Desulfosarcina alkanivorans TaxID=571177 RepID=A0A5K7YJ92_9BACT|nr:DNA recombination protein RmuC [Desulfosarcina alkanivorans]BBO68455.1 DNA recombination protein RmuC [Desulfosarcina alkanivorans]
MTQLQLIYLIGGTAGILLAVLIALLVVRSRLKSELAAMMHLGEMEKATMEEKLASARQQLETARADLASLAGQLDQRRDALSRLEAQKAALEQTAARIPVLEETLEKNRHGQEQLNAANLSLEKKLSETTTRLDAERRQASEKIALLNDARERLTVEFKVLAERILEEKGRIFADDSQARMDGLISPLREQLGDFKKRVEDVYDKESRDRATLLNEIGHLKNLNERIGKDALNLTNALKGDVKTLGGWGEVILERILEASGLEKGRAYETQVSLTDSRGSRYQPDVIIRLPEGRDVIVDAKVSLKAYERYHSSTDERVRSTAIKALLTSLRSHFNGLGEKHYEDLEGLHTLDFVLMFVPIEAAFFTALEHDRSLLAEAFEKNVILVSPSTLVVTLRTIHNLWRYADQNENALEIARQAGGLYDKFIGFIEAMEEVGRQLDRAREAHRTARDRLCSGRGNLVRRAEQLKALGVKANKVLPSSCVPDGEPGPDGSAD